MVSAINKAGYEGKVKIGMDVAASEFWKDEIKKYDLKFKLRKHQKDRLWLCLKFCLFKGSGEIFELVFLFYSFGFPGETE